MAKKGKKGKAGGKKSGQPQSDTSSASAPSPKRKNGKGKKRGKNHKSQWGTDEDNAFRKSLEADGRYTIQEMAADGNCLFRSLSDQLFQDHGQSHGDVRSAVCDYIKSHEDDFSVFLVLDENEEDEDAADFESYVKAMRQDGEWGGNLELVAASKLYRRNVTVFSANLSALTINHGAPKSSGADLLLSYHDNDHYSSVRDATSKNKPLVEDQANPNQPENKTEKAASNREKDEQDEVAESEDAGTTCSITTGNNEVQKKTAPKKNAQCPCGSGKKYKRCCWVSDKQEARQRKLKGGQDSEKDKTISSSDVSCEMNGNFRVLQI